MVTVDTIARVRRAYFVQGRKIKAIARDLRLARNTVRDIVRAGNGGAEETERRYVRKEQPLPQLGAFVPALQAMVAANAARSRRERLHAGGRLGEGTGREPGGCGPEAVLRAAPRLQDARRSQRVARRQVCRLCQDASPSGREREDGLRDAGGRASGSHTLVNKLEAETKLGRGGRIADGITRVDLLVLDELGYLPFAQSGGQRTPRCARRCNPP